MNGGARRESGQRENSSSWVGLVAVGMICVTIVAIVYFIWGQC